MILRTKYLCLATTCVLAGCDVPAAIPNRAELLNFRPSHIVPKTSPTAFVTAFRRYCLAGDSATAQGRLRADDYIPTRAFGRDDVYVVDDRKPMVMITDDGCAIRAASRAGQTNAVADFLATQAAEPVDPARTGAPGAESAWLLSDPAPALVLQTRTRLSARESHLSLMRFPVEPSMLSDE